ncbi:type VI secretion system baseplate subunit TssF [Gallaecimonas kandeliae]|uniref:type VI secretion system baseplate subunit TssF n=1 Tax=Gallaecimonas kandeliae TaxID=3029055 RepID=UPI002648A16E|nr:type VI secretion system baseplate subunit TssF [Gallaecimonas kandeliae]WKE65736.1 type VI secretion system baseplate subunit TssF [Gallaecimonas kandeliae]
MSETLLKYYNRELAYLRRQGAEFARQYPKVAGRLRISEEAVEDPHVSRLLEGVAFLTAQIRQRLDDDFSELSDILLGNLHPDYQAPIPSMSVVSLKPTGALGEALELPRGTRLKSYGEQVPRCEFSTGASALLAPIEVAEAKFENAPFQAPRPAGMQDAQAVLRLRLRCTGLNATLATLDLPVLQYFLSGQTHLSHELYELLHQQALGFALVPLSDGRKLASFPASRIRPLGFSDEEALVPYGDRSFSGYRLLVEHFLFPEKFLFGELSDLAGHWPDEKEADLYIYLRQGSEEQEKNLRPEHLRLCCAPVINLFQDILEPVPLADNEHEYQLVRQYEGAEQSEVIRIDRVELVKGEQVRELAPFYGMGHPRWQGGDHLYWHSRRRSADWAGGQYEPGTETYLSLVDRRLEAQGLDELPEDERLLVRAWCSNRNQPTHLPFGGGQPEFSAPEESMVASAQGLVAPTAPVRPELDGASRWQLLRHLTLDHFDGDQATQRLKEVLRLHDFRQSPESQALIDGIEKVSISPAVARVGSGVRRGLCQGNDILVQFSKPRYAGASVFLFSAVLDHFFAQFAQVNSFTRLKIRLTGHNSDYHVWPARVGERALL